MESAQGRALCQCCAVKRPQPEVAITSAMVRRLLSRQHPDLAALALEPIDSGWDNAMFRLGRELIVRLPCRAAAATLVEHEQRWLPELQPRLPLRIPVPLRIGRPDGDYPWSWSIVPWLPGTTAAQCAPDAGQAAMLAAFLNALHLEADPAAPENPFRGVPLAQRAQKFVQCAGELASRGRPLDCKLTEIWQAALAAPPAARLTWIHGDLHPLNVLIEGGRISGVIDWGDVARGDPATDLASIWLLLPQRAARAQAMALYSHAAADSWARARGWALLMAVIALAAGDAQLDLPATCTLQRLLEGP